MVFLSFFGFQTPAAESSEVHDVAVSSVTAWPKLAILDSDIHINVTVENQGTSGESFNLTVYSGNITVQTASVADLALGLNETLTFLWEIRRYRALIFPPPWPLNEPMIENATIWAEADVVDGG